ncbi:MAG: HemK/PrmC family methyltransferase [Porphyromonadaceae bacterium]|nr:HemK/PrmC family methyltransferase [Porphyromonadaceae bacterium]
MNDHPSSIAQYYAYGQRLLCPTYSLDEVRLILRQLLAEALDLCDTEVLLLDGERRLIPEHRTQLMQWLERLALGEPLQYVLGYTHFYGEPICVVPGVLIPRPETEELVEMIVASIPTTSSATVQVLDVGTGSGCIPCSLAVAWGERLRAEAWDISEEALGVAKDNFATFAQRTGAKLEAQLMDLFAAPSPWRYEPFDIIVSNPPYIHPSEATEMAPNVLEYEPHLALFAPETDPIAYYDALASLITKGYLAPNGQMYVEINPLYALETLERMSHIVGEELGSARIVTDLSGKERFIHLKTT